MSINSFTSQGVRTNQAAALSQNAVGRQCATMIVAMSMSHSIRAEANAAIFAGE